MNGAPKKRSPWVYVGIGCGALVLLALLGLVGVGVFGYRKVKQLEAELKDPAARAAKVAAVLGGDVPPGYHPVMALSIPFVMDMALLGDHPPDEKGAPNKRMDKGFVYVKAIGSDQQAGELKSYFEGKSADAEVLRRSNIHVNAEEVIRRGSLDLPGQTTLYVTQRGNVSMNDTHTQGLTTLVLIDCPQDTRQRLGIWFGPDPAPGQPVAEADWSGSIADEAVMREFLGHFKLCGA